MKISQAVTFLGDDGLRETRWSSASSPGIPELLRPPRPADIFRRSRSSTPTPTAPEDGRSGRDALATHQKPAPAANGRTDQHRRAARPGGGAVRRQRIDELPGQEGGFEPSRSPSRGRRPGAPGDRRLDGVAPVNVTARLLSVPSGDRRGSSRPRWESGPPPTPRTHPPQARWASRACRHDLAAVGGACLFPRRNWLPVPARRRPAGPLHGWHDLPTRLAVAARQADESPHGLWLLCPMEDPQEPPRLDRDDRPRDPRRRRAARRPR